MNNKDIQEVVLNGDDYQVEQVINFYSLPLFMLSEIINRKDLNKDTRNLAKVEKRERLEMAYC